jgi:hypothetical protein
MESEEDAKDAILDLKLKKRMFRNVPVKARLKSETTVKAYFAPPPPVPFVPMPFINNFEIGYGNAPGYVNNSLNAVGSPSANSSGDGKPLLDSPGNSSLKGDDRNSVSTGNQNSNAPRGGSDRRGNETRNQGDRSTTDSRKVYFKLMHLYVYTLLIVFNRLPVGVARIATVTVIAAGMVDLVTTEVKCREDREVKRFFSLLLKSTLQTFLHYHWTRVTSIMHIVLPPFHTQLLFRLLQLLLQLQLQLVCPLYRLLHQHILCHTSPQRLQLVKFPESIP